MTALSYVGGFSGNATNINATVIYGSGDVIQFQDTQLSTNTAAWNGGGASLTVMTGLETVMTALAAGDIAVYSDGTDTYFSFVTRSAVAGGGGGASSGMLTYKIDDADLVLTTAFGSVTLTTANFGFALAQNSGNTGINVTLS